MKSPPSEESPCNMACFAEAEMLLERVDLYILIAYVDHVGLHGANNNADAVGCCVNHLSATDVDSSVIAVDTNVTWLRVTYACPTHERARCAKA